MVVHLACCTYMFSTDFAPFYLVHPVAVEPGAPLVGGAVRVSLVLQRKGLVLQLGPHLALGAVRG